MTPEKEEIKTTNINTHNKLDEETQKIFDEIMEEYKEAWVILSKLWGDYYDTW